MSAKGWIKTSDKMPDETVLLLTTSKVIRIGDFYCGKWRIEGDGSWQNGKFKSNYDINDVTHWMPLPELPREGEKQVNTESKCNMQDISGCFPIDFVTKITGHDYDTIEQMYNDWRQFK